MAGARQILESITMVSARLLFDSLPNLPDDSNFRWLERVYHSSNQRNLPLCFSRAFTPKHVAYDIVAGQKQPVAVWESPWVLARDFWGYCRHGLSAEAGSQSKSTVRSEIVLTLLWLAAAIFSFYIQGKLFLYDSLPILPPLAILGALILSVVFQPLTNYINQTWQRLILLGVVTVAL